MSTVSFEQLVRADDAFGGLNLADAHFDFGEILDADFFAGQHGAAAAAAAAARGASMSPAAAGAGVAAGFLRFVFHGFDPLHCFRFFDAWEKWLQLPSAVPDNS